MQELSLANLALADAALEPLLPALEANTGLRKLNVETNFLSGEFLARLFQALLPQQSLAEVRAANQGGTFSSTSELDIMESHRRQRGTLQTRHHSSQPAGQNQGRPSRLPQLRNSTPRSPEAQPMILLFPVLSQATCCCNAFPTASSQQIYILIIVELCQNILIQIHRFHRLTGHFMV